MAPEMSQYPSGYRFVPTDSELVGYYLARQVAGLPLPPNPILEVEIYDYSPDDIFRNQNLSEENECYCFTSRTKKYPKGSRPERTAGAGFWKTTGIYKKIYDKNGIVGYKRALVYFKGTPKSKDKTNWLMTEYHIKHNNPSVTSNKKDMLLDKYVLCKICQGRHSSKKASNQQSSNVPVAQNIDKKKSENVEQMGENNLGGSHGNMTLDEMMQCYQKAHSVSKGRFIPQSDPQSSHDGQFNHIVDLNVLTQDEVKQYFQKNHSVSWGKKNSQSYPQPSHGGRINPFQQFNNTRFNDMDSEPSTSGSNEIIIPHQNFDYTPEAHHHRQFFQGPFSNSAGSATDALQYQPVAKIEGIDYDQIGNISVDDLVFSDAELDFLMDL